MQSLPQEGVLEKILVRPDKVSDMVEASAAEVRPGDGLIGDRFKGRVNSKRQITLFQAEHLDVLSSLLHCESIDPRVLRRNLIVRGISLNALKGRKFRVGDMVLEGTELCHPCSKMELRLGPGGYNAMRGIGGLCARVVSGGVIRRGDIVKALIEA